MAGQVQSHTYASVTEKLLPFYKYATAENRSVEASFDANLEPSEQKMLRIFANCTSCNKAMYTEEQLMEYAGRLQNGDVFIVDWLCPECKVDYKRVQREVNHSTLFLNVTSTLRLSANNASLDDNEPLRRASSLASIRSRRSSQELIIHLGDHLNAPMATINELFLKY